MKKVTIIVDGKKIHLVLGHKYAEWLTLAEGNEILWDIVFEEFLDGTLEPNENIWYWYINGRCYETTEEVMDE